MSNGLLVLVVVGGGVVLLMGVFLLLSVMRGRDKMRKGGKDGGRDRRGGRGDWGSRGGRRGERKVHVHERVNLREGVVEREKSGRHEVRVEARKKVVGVDGLGEVIVKEDVEVDAVMDGLNAKSEAREVMAERLKKFELGELAGGGVIGGEGLGAIALSESWEGDVLMVGKCLAVLKNGFGIDGEKVVGNAGEKVGGTGVEFVIGRRDRVEVSGKKYYEIVGEYLGREVVLEVDREIGVVAGLVMRVGFEAGLGTDDVGLSLEDLAGLRQGGVWIGDLEFDGARWVLLGCDEVWVYEGSRGRGEMVMRGVFKEDVVGGRKLLVEWRGGLGWRVYLGVCVGVEEVRVLREVVNEGG